MRAGGRLKNSDHRGLGRKRGTDRVMIGPKGFLLGVELGLELNLRVRLLARVALGGSLDHAKARMEVGYPLAKRRVAKSLTKENKSLELEHLRLYLLSSSNTQL